MTSTSNVSISFYLPVQVALLILFYGNILPTLPLWLVFLPTLIVLGALGVVIIVVIVAAIAVALS